MTARKNPPLLRVEPLSGKPVILTRYRRRDGLIDASEKWPVPERDFLVALEDLGVSDACLDEVAACLGMVRTGGDS